MDITLTPETIDRDRLLAIVDAGRLAEGTLRGIRSEIEDARDEAGRADVILQNARMANGYRREPPPELVKRFERAKHTLERLQAQHSAACKRHVPAIELAKRVEAFARRHLELERRGSPPPDASPPTPAPAPTSRLIEEPER